MTTITELTITRRYTTRNGRHGVCYTIDGAKAATFIPAEKARRKDDYLAEWICQQLGIERRVIAIDCATRRTPIAIYAGQQADAQITFESARRCGRAYVAKLTGTSERYGMERMFWGTDEICTDRKRGEYEHSTIGQLTPGWYEVQYRSHASRNSRVYLEVLPCGHIRNHGDDVEAASRAMLAIERARRAAEQVADETPVTGAVVDMGAGKALHIGVMY